MAEPSARREIDLARVIDTSPISAFQWRVFLLCAAIAFLDGVDTQVIGAAAPALGMKMGFARSAFGVLFSSGLVGAMLGALSCGLLADKWGRKRVLVVATAIFGVFTFITPWVLGLNTLLAVRFLAGVGLGGAVPCFVAMVTEVLPRLPPQCRRERLMGRVSSGRDVRRIHQRDPAGTIRLASALFSLGRTSSRTSSCPCRGIAGIGALLDQQAQVHWRARRNRPTPRPWLPGRRAVHAHRAGHAYGTSSKPSIRPALRVHAASLEHLLPCVRSGDRGRCVDAGAPHSNRTLDVTFGGRRRV